MSDYIKRKEYKLPDGSTVTAYFDELGCAKITIQAMDALFDILNSSDAQPTDASCWGCNCPKMERLKEQKTFSEMVHLHDAETHSCDPISRQEAIDTLSFGKEMLSRALDDMDVVGTDREKYSWGLGLIESNINDIEELPSAQQWTPCSERLPMTKDDYIITVKDKYGTWTDYVEWSADYHWWGYDDDMVIAWMPLPEPYKGEES